MKIKKMLRWVILIAIFLGLFLVQTVTFMYKLNMSFLPALILVKVVLSVGLVILALAVLVVEWIIEWIMD